MDEAISRQEVIKKLDEALESITKDVSKESDAYHIVYGTIGITKCMIMTIQPEPHWIPVTERLPKKCNTTYLATVDCGKYGRAVGQRFFFDSNIGWSDKDVIAYMPLPEPYKGVTE